MTISVRCQNSGCEKLIKVKDEFRGKRVKCPSCGEALPPAVVRPEAVERLDQVTHVVRTKLVKTPGKLLRKKFDAILTPQLVEAKAIFREIKKSPPLADDPTVPAAFDDFSAAVLQALAEKLDLTDEEKDRELMYGDPLRALLYMAIVKRRLLDLPLTEAKRCELELSMRRTTELLYLDFNPPADLDPSECFFFPGVKADADAALEVPLYKVLRATKVSTSYEPRRMLVPRSTLAAELHARQHQIKGLTDEKTEEIMAVLEDGPEVLAASAESQTRLRAYFRGIGGWWWMEVPAMLVGFWFVWEKFGQSVTTAAVVGCLVPLLFIRFLWRPICRGFVGTDTYGGAVQQFLVQYCDRVDNFPPFANAVKKKYEYGFGPGLTRAEDLAGSRLATRWADLIKLQVEVAVQKPLLESLSAEERAGLGHYVKSKGPAAAADLLRKLENAPPGPVREVLLMTLRTLGQLKAQGENKGSNT